MAFGYAGEPGTCLWCGKKLPSEKSQAFTRDSDKRFFHAGSCAAAFGVRMAELGKRFKPIEPSEVAEQK